MVRLDVGETVAETYKTIFNRAIAGRFLPFLAVVWGVGAVVLLAPVGEEPALVVRGVIGGVVTALVFLMFSVRWQRLAWYGEVMARPAALVPRRQDLRVLVYGVLVALILALAVLAMFGALSAVFVVLAGVSPIVGVFFGFVMQVGVMVAGAWLAMRLFLTFPAAAVDFGAPLLTSWRATRGAAGTVFLAALLAALPVLGLMLVVNMGLGAVVGNVLAQAPPPEQVAGSGAPAFPVKAVVTRVGGLPLLAVVAGHSILQAIQVAVLASLQVGLLRRLAPGAGENSGAAATPDTGP